MRTLFYATNGLGLGHVTRLLAISRALRRQDPSHEVLILSRCEAGPFPQEDAPFTLRIPGSASARRSGLSPKSYYQTTQTLLWQAVSSFDPHLLVTDTFPEGPEGELAPIMKWPIRKAFVYRDSRPEVFQERDLRPRLAPYQLILVAHEPETIVLPPWLRKDPRVMHTGVVSEAPSPDSSRSLRDRLGTAGETSVLVTLGGGGDPEAESVLPVILQKLRDHKVGLFVATGPPVPKDPGRSHCPGMVPRLASFPLDSGLRICRGERRLQYGGGAGRLPDPVSSHPLRQGSRRSAETGQGGGKGRLGHFCGIKKKTGNRAWNRPASPGRKLPQKTGSRRHGSFFGRGQGGGTSSCPSDQLPAIRCPQNP